MTKLALLNGRLIQLDAQTADQCNVFLGASGRVLGLGYVPDLEDDEFEQIDLKQGCIYPNVGTLSVNALTEVCDDACRVFAWSTEMQALTALDDVSKVSESFLDTKVPVTVLPDLTIEGRYVTPLEDFYRLGYVSFYQDLSLLDFEALEEAVKTVCLLQATVVLDCSKIDDQESLINDLVSFLRHYPDFRAVFIGLRSFEAFTHVMMAQRAALNVYVSVDVDVLKLWAKNDMQRVMDAIEMGFIVAVSDPACVSSLIQHLQLLQLSPIHIARLLSGAVRHLSGQDHADLSGGEFPSFVFFKPDSGDLATVIHGVLS